MKLTPREIDHLVLHQCGFLAQKRLARFPTPHGFCGSGHTTVPSALVLATAVIAVIG
jgi:hypothetical protein